LLLLRDFCRENKEVICDIQKRVIVLGDSFFPLGYEVRIKSDKGGNYTLGDIWFMFSKQSLSPSEYMAACNEAGFKTVSPLEKMRLIKWLKGEKTDLEINEDDDDLTINPPKRMKLENTDDDIEIDDDIKFILCQDIELDPQDLEEKDQITKMLMEDDDQGSINQEKESMTTFSQDSDYGLSTEQILSLKTKIKAKKRHSVNSGKLDEFLKNTSLSYIKKTEKNS